MPLKKINSPADLQQLSLEGLEELAEEIRNYIISVVAAGAGHFASNLGVVELSIALHRAFDAPRDKIIWDVGHQAYAHKILTGRKDQFPTIRRYGGLSGYPCRTESEFDPFADGHASTAIGAALGLAIARDYTGEAYKVVAVIGDGGMTGGVAYEALNAAGDMKKDLIVVLNDNQMSISPTVGAFSKYFNRIRTNWAYNLLRGGAREMINLISPDATEMARKIDRLISGGTFFRELGFRYFGPVDGHDIEAMLNIFAGAKTLRGPVLIHVITQKGKGYEYAESDPEKFHGVSGGVDIPTGRSLKPKSAIPTYSRVFADTLIKLAMEDDRIVALTAAMPSGTGLSKFMEVFPQRCFDVGIAEQCAVTLAAGMAAEENLKPVVAIYSTFIQRAYDQIVHNVCLQNLPVVFALDRAGLVGADGPTHHGAYDIACLRHIPNIVVMAPKDENELQQMLKTAVEYEGPIALRYPRGSGVGVTLDEEIESLTIGQGELLREGDDLLIIALGNRVHPALEAAEQLAEADVSATVINARFVKPLDENLLVNYAQRIGNVITVEDGAIIGGFGGAVLELFAKRGILCDVKIRSLGIPDQFVEHGPPELLHKLCGYDAEAIAKIALELVAG